MHPAFKLIPCVLAGLACTSVEDFLRLAPTSPAATALPATEAIAEVTPSAAPDASAISPDVLRQMEEIERQVSSLRGLQPTRPVARVLLGTEEVGGRIRQDFLGDYSTANAADDVLTLSLLGLLNPDIDLWNLYLDFYTEQVAGYYDERGGRMFIVGTEFGGIERLTYAHEFDHALQDQNYGIAEGLEYEETACQADSERCAAISALLEGDATLLQGQWLQTYATVQDFKSLEAFYDSYRTPVFDAAPAFLQKDWIFPYDSGHEFVRQLYLEAGWAGVDAAYANVPLSTEQILHPDRYPGDPPTQLDLPDLAAALGEGWREVKRSALGEWYTRLMLEKALDSEAAAEAAAGWEGDLYVSLGPTDPAAEGGALVLVTEWDGVGQAQSAFAALRDFGNQRYGHVASLSAEAHWTGTRGSARLERRANQTLWIVAPDAASVDALRAAVVFPAPSP